MGLDDTVDLMLSKNNIDRMLAEKLQLEIRICDLKNFLNSAPVEFDRTRKNLMVIQLGVMEQYLSILNQRYSVFDKGGQ